MQQRECGFSLVEMMIVVAIIVILGNIAVPTYQKYTQRAKYTELFTELSAARTAIELCAQLGELELSAPEACLSNTTSKNTGITVTTRTQGNSIWLLSYFTDAEKSGPLKSGTPNLAHDGADVFVAAFKVDSGELSWQQGCLGKHAKSCPTKNTLDN